MPTGPGDILEPDPARPGHHPRRRAGDHRPVPDDRGSAARRAAGRRDDRRGRDREATGGRRRRSLAFNTSQSHVVAAAVDTTHTRIAVTDLGGRGPGRDRDRRRRSRPDRRWCSTRSRPRWPTLLEQARPAVATTSAGSGSACPGRSTRCPGDPASRRSCPGWDAYPVAEHLQAALPGVPVLTANDADAAALGEYAAGHDGLRVAVPGQGLDRHRHRHRHRRAAPTPGPTAAPATSGTCGSRRGRTRCASAAMQGCLAAVASGRAVAAELTDARLPGHLGARGA